MKQTRLDAFLFNKKKVDFNSVVNDEEEPQQAPETDPESLKIDSFLQPTVPSNCSISSTRVEAEITQIENDSTNVEVSQLESTKLGIAGKNENTETVVEKSMLKADVSTEEYDSSSDEDTEKVDGVTKSPDTKNHSPVNKSPLKQSPMKKTNLTEEFDSNSVNSQAPLNHETSVGEVCVNKVPEIEKQPVIKPVE